MRPLDSPKNIRGRVTAPKTKVTRETRQRHTNEVRGIGGAVSTFKGRKLDARGMSAVTAVSTSANNGQWTERIMRKDRQDRRVTVRTLSPAELSARRAASPRYATA